MKQKLPLLLAAFCCCSLTMFGQEYISVSQVSNNGSQAKDLNVINASSNPDTANSTSMSVFGMNTNNAWGNGFTTKNMPPGVTYGLGVCFTNPLSSSDLVATYAMQLIGSTDDTSLLYRFNTNGYQGGSASYNGWGPWIRIWNSMDDGEGSGLDADLIHGQEPQWTTDAQGDVINTNTGNIGIGTNTTDGYKLAVNGSIISTKFSVKTYGNWPDYVLASQYNLTPLPEVARYISANNHLPEIPSASDLDRSHLDLGDMQGRQMKKIEELTLYAIDADKRITQQDSLIRQQQAMLSAMQSQLKAEQEEIRALNQKISSDTTN